MKIASAFVAGVSVNNNISMKQLTSLRRDVDNIFCYILLFFEYFFKFDIQSNLCIADTYIADTVHNGHLFPHQMTILPVYSGHKIGFEQKLNKI